MRATRFPERASGPAARLSGFLTHLRMNGLKAGPSETRDALAALNAIDAADPGQARLAMKALLASGQDIWTRFDDLFDAYWFNVGKQRQAEIRSDHLQTQSARPTLWQPHLNKPARDGGEGDQTVEEARPDQGDGDAEGADGRLIATRTDNLSRRDLREVMDETTLRQAEAVAKKLAQALRSRTSRRHRASRTGRRLDMRRILRSSLTHGGEPVELHRRRRPDRPMRVVVLCDVSGSMTVYARVFLAFVKGLISTDTRADAYIFHTRLMRVTPALRDHDTLRAAGRLSLMAEGFGGGTDIAGSLRAFNDSYGMHAVGRRTAVFILSDGYCTSPPQDLAAALSRLRRRASRIVWMNPLLGWKNYAPVANGIAAALPFVDAHLPANTIEAIAGLESEIRRI